MNSPKGKYRIKEFAIAGVIFLILVGLSGGFDQYGDWQVDRALNANGWIFKQINNIAEIFIGLTLLYWGSRVINHKRTHDFLKCKQHALLLMMTWIIAISMVIGSALR